MEIAEKNAFELPETMVKIVLKDGPEATPKSITGVLTPHLDRIIISLLERYEHYELDPSTATSTPVSSCWAMRIKIAG